MEELAAERKASAALKEQLASLQKELLVVKGAHAGSYTPVALTPAEDGADMVRALRRKVDALALAQLAASLDQAGIDCAAGVSEEAMRVALHSYLLRQAHAEDRALTHDDNADGHDDDNADGHDDMSMGPAKAGMIGRLRGRRTAAAVFAEYDIDGSGDIDTDELELVCASLGQLLGRDGLADLFGELATESRETAEATGQPEVCNTCPIQGMVSCWPSVTSVSLARVCCFTHAQVSGVSKATFERWWREEQEPSILINERKARLEACVRVRGQLIGHARNNM